MLYIEILSFWTGTKRVRMAEVNFENWLSNLCKIYRILTAKKSCHNGLKILNFLRQRNMRYFEQFIIKFDWGLMEWKNLYQGHGILIRFLRENFSLFKRFLECLRKRKKIFFSSKKCCRGDNLLKTPFRTIIYYNFFIERRQFQEFLRIEDDFITTLKTSFK